MDGEEVREQISNMFYMLDQILQDVGTDGPLPTPVEKFCKVRDRLYSFFFNNKYINSFLNDEDFMRTNFSLHIGQLSGTILYYKKNNSLTKDHIEDLNKIYKQYK